MRLHREYYPDKNYRISSYSDSFGIKYVIITDVKTGISFKVDAKTPPNINTIPKKDQNRAIRKYTKYIAIEEMIKFIQKTELE